MTSHIPNLKKTEKTIELLLSKTNLRTLTLARKSGGNMIVDQVNQHLLFISANRQYMYDMTYECNYDGHTHVPDNCYIYENMFVLRIIEFADRTLNPDQFITLLKRTPKGFQRRNYNIYLDNELIYKDAPQGWGISLLDRVKTAQANKKDINYEKYKDVKSVILVNPAGNRTIYLLHDTPKKVKVRSKY